jgi:hypothetical protein
VAPYLLQVLLPFLSPFLSSSPLRYNIGHDTCCALSALLSKSSSSAGPTPNTSYYITGFSLCACVIGWTLRGRRLIVEAVCETAQCAVCETAQCAVCETAQCAVCQTAQCAVCQTAQCAVRITGMTTVKCACFLRNPFSISQGKMDFRGNGSVCLSVCLSLLSLCFCGFEPVLKCNFV